ncbi:hypothetical protein BN946_scf184473.g37 [Trametes cinnabarina]|uniref:BHLH domain-containing protein n=1 Tax=Pycnoporus cinnabarinus TaxID=5643 RepID=A0A060SX40_PYCCI|nr:hypothetical protein BN946_scf184473.g37 [Trametes cinnabarina]
MHSFFQQEPGQDAGDIFADAASQGSQQQPQQPQQQAQPSSYQQQILGNMQQANMELLGSLLGSQDTSNQTMQAQSHQSQSLSQVLLEQQIKLNVLQQLLQQQQQLQNEIMQQQMGMLGSQSSFSLPPLMDRARDAQQYGLPTPAPSTELRAQQNTDFISPMLLHSNNTTMGPMVQNPPMLSNFVPHHMLPPAPHSAPANIVFNTQAIPISPGELDFNELHIPSPFLGPHNNAGSTAQMADPSVQNTSGPSALPPSGKRRNTSSSGDESSVTSKPARKRQSPAIRAPSMGPSSNRRGSVRSTRSANSTPLFPASSSSTRPSPAQRSIQASGDTMGDTPSPVDPPMPPPVHPASYTPPVMTSNPSTTSSSPPIPSTPASPTVAAPPGQITPVTPASMLKLGRLAMSSALTSQPITHEEVTAQKPKTQSAGSKAKAVEKAGSMSSPGLKPIRPAGNAVMTPIATSPTTPFTQPMHVRKTSHKAAEQKRRDSLKTSFDDLRVLLPPIPLPSEDGFPDEPILPGAMPPRGPPKGNSEGPNRGVSKLQLLRCGNEFIKVLKSRVERRDEEIAKLRQEVRRLREIVGEEAAVPTEGQEMLDLERDLDACEIAGGGLFRRMRASSITEGDGEQEGDY